MRDRLSMAVACAVLVTLAWVAPASAQRGVGAKPGPVGGAATGSTFARGGRGSFQPAPLARSFFHSRRGGWGLGPGWGGGGFVPYDSDYEEGGYPPPPYEAPPMVVVRPEPPRQIQPMLLELHGDQWVKVTGYSEAPAGAAPVPGAPPGSPVAEARQFSPPVQIPPAVLVFRDGHQQEVTSYTIIGGTLYAHSNYWATGTWTQPIRISNLDVPATLKLNQERGSRFRLPSGPQEVVIRP